MRRGTDDEEGVEGCEKSDVEVDVGVVSVFAIVVYGQGGALVD